MPVPPRTDPADHPQRRGAGAVAVAAPAEPGRPAIVVTALLAALALLLPLGLAPDADAAPREGRGDRGPAFPRQLALPEGFAPEGIAIGTRPVAYLGDRDEGDVLRLDLRTGRSRVVSEGPGTPSLGLDHERRQGRDRLWVAGGTAGDARLVAPRSGRVLDRFAFGADPTFVNDVVVTGGSAWFTDSLQPQLYRVDADQGASGGRAVETLALTGEWEQTEGLNANGIAPTPDGSALLVVQSSTGYLFRVDPATGVATRVDLGDTLLTNGDGLLVEGRVLYAVQNRLDQVAVVRLARDGSRGTLRDTLTAPGFDVPTTVARFGNGLYLPNARFSSPDATDFSVTRVGRR